MAKGQSLGDILQARIDNERELATCERILARRQADLDFDRAQLSAIEIAIYKDLEAILHVKRRMLELETLIARRAK